MINPVLSSYPEEARLLGEMVLGYGEIDLAFALVAGVATGQRFSLIDAANQVRSETARLNIINAIAAERFSQLGLKAEYQRIDRATRFCLKLRNQWAHSQWANMGPYGLAFARIDEKIFSPPLKATDWCSITLDLLQKQEAFFEYCRGCILTVESNLPAVLAGKAPRLPMPQKIHEPHTQNQWSRQARTHIAQGQMSLPQGQP